MSCEPVAVLVMALAVVYFGLLMVVALERPRPSRRGRHRRVRLEGRDECPAQHRLTVTDTEGVAHLVTEQSLAAGHRAGRYLARCDCSGVAP